MKKILITLTALILCIAAYADSTPKDLSKLFNDKCPVKIDDGVTLESVKYTDDGFVFNYLLSNDMFASFSQLGNIVHESTIAEYMSSPDKNVQQMVAMCIDKGIAITLLYHSPDQDTFAITITPEELK